MSGPGDHRRPGAREESPEARRARLAEVFGDVLPDSTRDDRDDESPADGDADAWLRAQVPPHHGS